MDTIHKYPIDPFGPIQHKMPIGAKIVHVDMQRVSPCMWVRVNTAVTTEFRSFVVVGTGFPIPDKAEYIGSFQDSSFVGHLFEIL